VGVLETDPGLAVLSCVDPESLKIELLITVMGAASTTEAARTTTCNTVNTRNFFMARPQNVFLETPAAFLTH
jgi:hypothetical protein